MPSLLRGVRSQDIYRRQGALFLHGVGRDHGRDPIIPDPADTLTGGELLLARELSETRHVGIGACVTGVPTFRCASLGDCARGQLFLTPIVYLRWLDHILLRGLHT